MTLPSSWLIQLNRRHFRFRPPSDDPVAYARWEFEEGRRVWERFFAGRVSVAGKEVLDIGCGPGGKTCFLATLGPHRVVGVDFIPEAVRQAEQAREILPPPEDRLRVEFVCVDAAILPFPDAYFDVIVCSDAFEHFAEPRKVLAESARVLKPDGLMAIDFAQWGAHNGHHLGDFFATPWCHVFWSERAVAEALKALAIIERERLADPRHYEALNDLVKRRLEQFHHGLNRMSLGKFERFLRDEGRLRVRWRRRTAGYPILWPLIFVPGLRELAVARNVYLLERVTA